MSTNTQSKAQAGGTQSPTLESTGADKPMGMSSVDKGTPADHAGVVSDSEQRSEYFVDSDKSKVEKKPEMLGRSLADKQEKRE